MAAFIHNVTFAARKPKVLGAFWSAVTGYAVVEASDDYVRLQATDNRSVRHLIFYRTERQTAATDQIHLELAARDPRTEIDRLIDLGAQLVDPTVDGQPTWREGNGTTWVVLRDPEGNRFCIA